MKKNLIYKGPNPATAVFLPPARTVNFPQGQAVEVEVSPEELRLLLRKGLIDRDAPPTPDDAPPEEAPPAVSRRRKE